MQINTNAETAAQPSDRYERILWIDLAKAVGAWFIIYVHLIADIRMFWALRVICSINVSLFFMLSGFIFHIKNTQSVRTAVGIKARRLLLPYALFSVVTFLVSLIKHHEGWLKEFFEGFIFLKGSLYYNIPLWFLIVLFEVYAAEYLLKTSRRGTAVQCIVIACAFLLGYAAYAFREVFQIPFGLDKAIIAYGFFALGILLRDRTNAFQKDLFPAFRKRLYWLLLFVCVLIWITAGVLFNQESVDFYSMRFGHYPLFLIGSVFGCLSFIHFCRMIDPFVGRWLRWNERLIILELGTQSLWIRYFRFFMRRLGIAYTVWYDLISVVTMIVYILLLRVVYELLSKRVPLLRALNGQY